MLEITTNTLEISRARREFLGSLGLDAKRATAWIQYGYSEHVSFEMLYAAYERGGAGHGAVHRLLDVCWLKLPRIKLPNSDKKSPWEVKTGKVLRSIRAWSKLKDLDRRNLVGRYAAVIYRVADSKTLDQPLERATKLVDLIPLSEIQIKVTKWHADQDAENYGTPAMFQYRQISPPGTETEGRPEKWADVHPSRVQILAEGAVGDFYEGVPLLRAGFNRLVDLDKIAGGSGESFLKNSARTIVFRYDAGGQPQAMPGPDGKPVTSVKDAHEAQAKALNQNQDASIVMQGGEATTLQTAISDPTGPWTTAANEFAASVRIPFTVLFGQQTGRLASDEDKSDFANRCSSRQEFELTPMLEEFIILDIVLLEIAAALDRWVQNGKEPKELFWWNPFVEQAAQLGALQSVTNLTNLSEAYAASRSFDQVVRSEPYLTRVALARMKSYEHWTGLRAEGQSRLAGIIGRAVADGLNPKAARTLIVDGLGVTRSKAAQYAQTDITDTLRQARWAESEAAQVQYGLKIGMLWTSALLPTTRATHATRNGRVYSTDEVRAFYGRDGNRYNCHCGQTECLLDASGKPILTESLKQKMALELANWSAAT